MVTNTEKLPLDINDVSWIYETKKLDSSQIDDVGKWLLFFDKKNINANWIIIRDLYRNNRLKNILSIKCSTGYENTRAYKHDNGVIILYCDNSLDKQKILDIGSDILHLTKYAEEKKIYYKTDSQTLQGTIATGNKQNSTYTLLNPYYNDIEIPIDFQNGIDYIGFEENKHDLCIERKLPSYKKMIKYPLRYQTSTIEECKKMLSDNVLQNAYNKWKDGINYKTNRKIKINGKIHDGLKTQFMIHGEYPIDKYGNKESFYELFEIISDKLTSNYEEETANIYTDIDYKNKIIENYNKPIIDLTQKVNALQSWSEYVEYDGKKYGTANKIVSDIHIENNCNGKIIKTDTQKKECKGCWDGMMFNAPYQCSCSIWQIEKCDKCNFVHEYFIDYAKT